MGNEINSFFRKVLEKIGRLFNLICLLNHINLDQMIDGTVESSVVSRANYLRKTGGRQNWQHPNREMQKIFTMKNNWERLNMFKATEAERKKREINLLISLQITLSSCRTTDHYFLLSLHRL